MNELCVFAGTTEGRKLTAFLCDHGVPVYGCTATQYGGTLLESQENLTVSSLRLEEGQMEALFSAHRFSYVIDATHPYAPIVTKNIQDACAATDTPYLRLLREQDAIPEDALFVESTAQAVEALRALPGNILLTTGSKELPAYSALPDFAERAYARVLPVEASLAACRACGLPAAHIFAMQGPFSLDMNLAMLKSINAKILVTKESGATGGFPEKAEAARQAGARLLVIGRPPQVAGMSFEEMAAYLADRLHISVKKEIAIVGIGPGNRENMTAAARDATNQAECLIGARRMLDAVALPGQKTVEAIAPEAILSAIEEIPLCRRFAVVMSGDVGFFSGAKRLLPLLEGHSVRLIPGLSSLVTLCARLGKSYEDVQSISLHGRDGDIVAALRRSPRVFTLVGGENGIQNLCANLTAGGMGNASVFVGERLGYPEETITRGTAAELAQKTFDPLSAALIEYDCKPIVTHGLPDELFLRGSHSDGTAVPMTKREIRSVALSLLELTEDGVCYDIGAGTGSVAVEMALQVRRGQVWAVERKADVLPLLEENRRSFHVPNLHIVSGDAPDALKSLPKPTHVFIGGSGGNLKEILHTVFRKNPKARVVVSAIALETVSELAQYQREFPLSETQALCVNVAKDRKAGTYHLMTGQNPVYLFLFQGEGL